MLCIILTLHNPTYKYDPIVNFQVRMVKWLATTSFIKDTVVSQLFLLTSYSTTLCVCSVVSTSFLMIISFVMEKSLRSVRQMRYWAEKVWFEEKKLRQFWFTFPYFSFDTWWVKTNDSRDISAWLHFTLLII